MNTSQIIILPLLLASIALASSSVRADLIYQLDSYDAFNTPNWTLESGTIVTDGTLGEINVSNIVSWSITYRSNERNFELTPANSVALLRNDGLGGLVATSSELLMTSTNQQLAEILRFLEPTPSLLYGVDYQAANGLIGGRVFLLDEQANPTFARKEFAPLASFRIGVAAVPEPSSACLMGVVLALGIALRRRNRSHSQTISDLNN